MKDNNVTQSLRSAVFAHVFITEGLEEYIGDNVDTIDDNVDTINDNVSTDTTKDGINSSQ